MKESNIDYSSGKDIVDPRKLTLLKENYEKWRGINPHDDEYGKLLLHILENGIPTEDRTGVGTIFTLGYSARFNIEKTSPYLSQKKIYLKAVFGELAGFVHGDTNIRDYIRRGSNIWNEWPYRHFRQIHGFQNKDTNSDEWRNGLKEFIEKVMSDEDFAEKWGDLGPIYGKQWRRWSKRDGSELDQLEKAINILKKNPFSRQNIISAWKADEIEAMQVSGLPPCHFAIQLKGYKENDEMKLGTVVYQRSADSFLGVPFNMAQYDAFSRLIGKLTDLKPSLLVFNFGDLHIYKNHINQINTLLSRKPYPNSARLEISPEVKSLDDFEPEKLKVTGYDEGDFHPFIKAPIAV